MHASSSTLQADRLLNVYQLDGILYAINVSCDWSRLLYAAKTILSIVECTFHVPLADALIHPMLINWIYVVKDLAFDSP
jgi:hypothetical protein